MHVNYTKFNAFKYKKKPTISVPNELSVPNVRKKNIREEPFSLLNIS